MDEVTGIDKLRNISNDIDSKHQDLIRLEGEVKDAKSQKEKLWGEWQKELGDVAGRIKEGRFSLGSNEEDYLLVNRVYDKFGLDNISLKAIEMKNILDETVKRGHFIYNSSDEHQSKSYGRIRAYRVGFFGEDPVKVSPTSLDLRFKKTLDLILEPTFGKEELMWPYFNLDEKGRTESVNYKDSFRGYGSKVLPSYLEDIDGLEKELINNNPLAVLELRKIIGREVSQDLIDKAEEMKYKAALTAVQEIGSLYQSLKDSDDRVMQAERKWGSTVMMNREGNMGHTRPVVLEVEPDLVMMRIASYDDRQRSSSYISRLVSHFKDLERTGLSKFNRPVEISGRVGEKKVYNLREFAGHIGNVLEIGFLNRDEVKV